MKTDSPRSHRIVLFFLQAKVAIPLMILLAIVSAPFVYRARQLSGLPDIGDPFDVEAFGTVSIPDEENAFIEYRAAVKLLVPLPSGPDVEDELDKALEEGWKAASPVIRKWIADNRPALDMWRRGTEKPGALYHQPRDVTISTLLEVAQELRGFSRKAGIEASRLADAGDMQTAWEWHRAVFRSSRHSGMHGTLIERLVGYRMHGMAAGRIVDWSADTRVTPEQLREALNEIREGYKATAPTSENVKVEYLLMQKIMMVIMNTDDLSELVSAFDMGSNEMPKELKSVQVFLKNEPELSRRLFQHLYANALARVDKPLHARTVSGRAKSPRSTIPGIFAAEAGASAGANQLTNEELTDRFTNSLVARAFLPAMDQFDEAIRREQAKQAALVVILAAEIYKREQGKYPEKAEDLVGKYLDALPADPYGIAGEAIHYLRDENGIVVWGLGENGVDDDGNIEYNSDNEFPDIGLRSGNYPKPVVP